MPAEGAEGAEKVCGGVSAGKGHNRIMNHLNRFTAGSRGSAPPPVYPMAKPTISDVAREAGVSKATVSAALNRKGTVGAETQERVEAAAQRLNYRPRAAARRLGHHAEPAIGIIVKDIANPFFAEVIQGAEAAARARGYLLSVCLYGDGLGEELRVTRALQHQGVQGLVISPSAGDSVDYSYLYELKRERYPFVLLEAVRGINASLVEMDNLGGAKAAAAHLIGLGHARIYHFSGPAHSPPSEERLDGVRRAFTESHIAFPEDAVVVAGATLKDGYEAATRFFGRRLEALPREAVFPAGITCFNDLVALGVWAALRELGVAVPEEASIVGYDDVSLLAYLPNALTTVRSPITEMGLRAAELLVEQIEAPETAAPQRVTLRTELVVRASTAAPAPAGLVAAGPGMQAAGHAYPAAHPTA